MEELTEVYKPRKILFRDEEVNELKERIRFYKEKKIVTNIIIHGGSGSGKTTIINAITDETQDCLYLSCANTQSSKKIFRKLYNSEFSKIIERFKQEPKIFIFDEINKIKDLTEFFDDINTFYRQVQSPIILITNRQDINKKMPDDARLTLFFEKIFFKSYNALQIKEILKERLKEARENGKIVPEIPEGAFSFISALAISQGSIRLAFRLLNEAIESEKFSVEDIEKDFARIQREEVLCWIETLNETEKMVLKGLIEIPLSHQYDNKFINEVEYSELAKYLFEKTPIKTSARLSQILWRFQYDDIVIKTKDIWLGRAGGKRKVISIISEEMFATLLGIFFPNYEDLGYIDNKNKGYK